MKKIVLILFLVSVFLISFLPVKDTDFGWHYRYETNNSSYYLPRYQSAYPSFFYDVPLAFVYDRFGFAGISLLGALIMTASATIFILITPGLLLLKILSYYAILFFSWSIFGLGLRSQIITYLFFLASLLIVKKAEAKPSYLLLFPPLSFLWANTHIGFFVGLIVLFLSDTQRIARHRLFVPIIFVFSLLATLINPFGVNVYREIVNHALSPLNAMIAEWVGPPLWQIALITLSGLLLVFYASRKKSLTLSSSLLLLFFALLSLKARRNIPFYYTVFFFVLLNSLNLKDTPITKNVYTVFLPLLTALTVLLFVTTVPQTISFDAKWNEYCSKGLSTYPCEAIKNFPQLSGNVFSMYEWGGFLIWQKPAIKIFVDGRMPAWKDENGESPYKVFLDIIQTQDGWNEKLKKYKTDYLLIAQGTFLDLLLQKETARYGWQEKYRDNIAVVYEDVSRR